MNVLHLLYSPFIEYGFMRRALIASLALAISGAPLGVFLVLRRMTLVGDAVSHAVLPGVSIAFLWWGVSLPAMTAGGIIAGLLVALIAGSVSRFTQLQEDSSFTGSYLISLALGVMILSLKGNAVDVMHVLFGNVLAVDNHTLLLVATIATISSLTLAVMYRSLIVECVDGAFVRSVGKGAWVPQAFLALVVLNLVAAFQAFGTLMALAVMVLPAIAARFWTNRIDGTIGFAVVASFVCSWAGLLLSYVLNVPSGPAIVLSAGTLYVLSLLIGRYGSVRCSLMPQRHFVS